MFNNFNNVMSCIKRIEGVTYNIIIMILINRFSVITVTYFISFLNILNLDVLVMLTEF